MSQVILRNTKPQVFQTTEYHHTVCRRRRVCKCKVTRMAGPRGKPMSHKAPRGLAIYGGQEASVDLEVLHLQHVKDALQSGWLERADPATGKPMVYPTLAEKVKAAKAAETSPKPAKPTATLKPKKTAPAKPIGGGE